MRVLFFFILIFSLFGGEVFAAIESYTPPPKEDIINGAASCLKSQKPLNEKYTCPTGEFSDANLKANSKEVTECSIQLAISFYEIDAIAKKWLVTLQKSRDPDFMKWQAEIQKTLFDDSNSLESQYLSVCDIKKWSQYAPDYGCAKTTNFFPESTCSDLANKKIRAWKNTGYVLATKGIAKNAQNSKDEFIDKQKNAYDLLLDKWNYYKRTLANAVAKMSAIVRNPVK